MKVYKITRKDKTTYNDFKWRVKRWYKVSGEGQLCEEGWLHCYSHPYLAVLMNPIHGGYEDYILWEAEARGKHLSDHGLKEGYSGMRLIKQIPIPEFTTIQRVAFCILCVKEVCKDRGWNQWADKWLSGEDRTREAAAEAAARAAWAARAAAEAAWAARAAAEAARTEKTLDLVAIAEKAREVRT